MRIDVDPGHLGAEILSEEHRDPARAAGNVEHRRHARSEPGRELVGLGSLHPSRLAEVLAYVTLRTRVWTSDRAVEYVFS